MNKHIIFFMLIITSTTLHGMKRPANIFQNNDTAHSLGILLQTDLLPQFTAGIYSGHKYQPKNIKTSICTLSLTNKSFHDYYAQEKVKQEIIDLCLPYHNSNSKDIARDLGCRSIDTKIKHFTSIARKKDKAFSADDLKDPWYLGVTTTYKFDYNFYQEPLNQPLVYVAIDHGRLQKAITILKHAKKLHFNYGDENNPLRKIAHKRATFTDQMSPKDYKQLLTIAQGLLQKGINPDGREKNTQWTPLFTSVLNNDTELVRLLLEYDADPYLIAYDVLTKETFNAFDFDVEPETGWLQNIIDEVNAEKNNQNEQENSCIKK